MYDLIDWLSYHIHMFFFVSFPELITSVTIILAMVTALALLIRVFWTPINYLYRNGIILNHFIQYVRYRKKFKMWYKETNGGKREWKSSEES